MKANLFTCIYFRLLVYSCWLECIGRVVLLLLVTIGELRRGISIAYIHHCIVYRQK